MTSLAQRVKAMRDRRRAQGLRELRMVVPDSRLMSVRRRVAVEVARLDEGQEREALSWIEEVSIFDAPNAFGQDETR